MKKYKQNLDVINNEVYSYNTLVATIEGNKLLIKKEYEKYSATTSKHINYVANELNLIKEVS